MRTEIGYFTLLAADLVGPAGRVIAIEPESYNFGLLTRNIRANRLSNVTALNIAVGAESGTSTIYKSAENYGDHRVGAESQSGPLPANRSRSRPSIPRCRE